MWKRTAPFLLALAVILSLTACGSRENVPLRGTVEGSKYTSESLGIVLTLDDSWDIADDAQIAELSGTVTESLDDEKIRQQMEDGSVVYDLYAVNAEGSSINITIQKLNPLGSALVTEEAFAEAYIKQLPETLAAAGITVNNIEKTTVTFAGQERVALKLAGEVQGIPLYETIVLIKEGSYIYSITNATFLEDTTPDLVALFKAK